MSRSTWLVTTATWLMTATCGAGEVRLDGQTFTLPDGFTIERVAGPPLVDRPIVADFDEQGRLYVADSSGSSDPVEQQLAEKPHRIVRLEDTDGDGVFDRGTVFADRMMFPEGTLWHDGSLYVSAPPVIWKLTDTDDDGIADRREVWYDAKTLTGCANDLHGPYLGPDGWIYWCKGAFAEQTHELPGVEPFTSRAAHIFRRHPSGGPVEPVMTGGMDNPVDVAFLPNGERFFTTTFLQHPAGGRRDGIIHAVHGGIWGKIHDPIFDPVHRWTDPEVMPVMTHLGPAAPSGLMRYEGEAFGADFRDNLFAACFNMRKVTRHELRPDGATYATTDTDFLASDNLDFHPTDVIEDADGSLLLINTGGWYKLCCPTSQLQKEDVLGAIYRIRREGAPGINDPRGLKIDWPNVAPIEYVGLLGDPRPAVRTRARDTLASIGFAATAVVEAVFAEPPTPAAPGREDAGAEVLRRAKRAGAVWVACRIGHDVARDLVRRALSDPDETVRQAALHSVSLWRDRDAAITILESLSKPSPHERRLAAEALGRIGDSSAVPALLAALAEPADRYLTHALTYALIEINDPEATAKGLTSDNTATRRAALIALDQMGGDHLDPRKVVPLLASGEASLREAASWIVGRRPEWGEALAEVFQVQMESDTLNDAGWDELQRQLASLADSPPITRLIAEAVRDAPERPVAAIAAMRAMAASNLRGDQVPESWVEALGIVLTSGDPEAVRQAVRSCRALAMTKGGRTGELAGRLIAIGGDPEVAEPARLDALAAVPGGLDELDQPVFAFLVTLLTPERTIDAQLAAVDVLLKASLSDEHLRAPIFAGGVTCLIDTQLS